MSLKRGKISKKEVEIIEQLYKEGSPIEDIAEQLNRGLDPVYKLIKKNGFKRGEVKAQQNPFAVNQGGGKVVAKPNTFVDTEIDTIDAKVAIEKDAPLYQKKPVPRGQRQTAKLVKSQCKICENIYEIQPSLCDIEGTHTCSQCIRSNINK